METMVLDGWLEGPLFGLLTRMGCPASAEDVLVIDVFFVLVVEDFLHVLRLL